jgi:hypothetical protein
MRAADYYLERAEQCERDAAALPDISIKKGVPRDGAPMA